METYTLEITDGFGGRWSRTGFCYTMKDAEDTARAVRYGDPAFTGCPWRRDTAYVVHITNGKRSLDTFRVPMSNFY